MGIQNLLRLLANSTRAAHISEFENQYVAVDAYCWLHKGIYCCSVELAMKKPTTKYVTYCMRYIEMLLHFKVKPILVFDGRTLSSKKETEKKRREERQRKYKKGIELIRAGQMTDGRKLLGESVDVTHELVLNLIKECRKMNIDCIVAPHEADAQLAYFSITNVVGCVITEDSDLLAYGCERVMFKMDVSGQGQLIEKGDLHLSLGMDPDMFNEDKFCYMCILSGCDYLPSLNSIGPANALKFIKMIDDKDIYEVLPKLPIYLNKMKVKVTPEYVTGFEIAFKTFKHQLVYDPFHRKQVPLRPVSNEDDIIGEKIEEDEAFQLAIGNIDPITMKKLDDFDPDKYGKGFDILWKTDFLPKAVPKKPISEYADVVNGSKKRLREVSSFSNDLKKQRMPENMNKISAGMPKAIDKIPQTGFIFEPKVEEPKRDVLKTTRESKLLRSRYFSSDNAVDKEKPKSSSVIERRKNESYDEYLQRVCDEYFNDDEEAEDEEEDESSKDVQKPVEETASQMFSRCLKKIEELKKNDSHSCTLDDSSKRISPVESEEKVTEEPKAKTEELSDCENLDFSLMKLLTQDKPDEESEETEKKLIFEKEDKLTDVEEVPDEKLNSSDRSPSPVFKLQTKVLNSTCRLGNIPDTTNTPTSVFFSSGSKILEQSRTPVTSKFKMPSIKSFTSVPSKGSKRTVKSSSSVNRTLFQFGFKKENKEESKKKA